MIGRNPVRNFLCDWPKSTLRRTLCQHRDETCSNTNAGPKDAGPMLRPKDHQMREQQSHPSADKEYRYTQNVQSKCTFGSFTKKFLTCLSPYSSHSSSASDTSRQLWWSCRLKWLNMISTFNFFTYVLILYLSRKYHKMNDDGWHNDIVKLCTLTFQANIILIQLLMIGSLCILA